MKGPDMNIFLVLNSWPYHCAVGLKGKRLGIFSTSASLEILLIAVTQSSKMREDWWGPGDFAVDNISEIFNQVYLVEGWYCTGNLEPKPMKTRLDSDWRASARVGLTFGNLWASLHYLSRLKSATIGVFIPWKWSNVLNWCSLSLIQWFCIYFCWGWVGGWRLLLLGLRQGCSPGLPALPHRGKTEGALLESFLVSN